MAKGSCSFVCANPLEIDLLVKHHNSFYHFPDD